MEKAQCVGAGALVALVQAPQLRLRDGEMHQRPSAARGLDRLLPRIAVLAQCAPEPLIDQMLRKVRSADGSWLLAPGQDSRLCRDSWAGGLRARSG